MIKRLKSFGIVFGSVVLTAFISLLPTVEFANFVGWLKDLVIQAGVPTVVWAFGSALIAQIWFAWRNRVIISKAVESGEVAGASNFSDTHNELY